MVVEPSLRVSVSDHGIQIGDRCLISLQRTLRIPDDGRVYPLPPGLGLFPVFPVSRFAEAFAPDVADRSDVFVPMYQREALWLGFHAADWKPNAAKVSIGGVNAVSGEAYHHELHDDPQDYLVCPHQPWLDGVNVGGGVVRQFVAMPLGMGYTVEAALTGGEERGGLQVTVYEPKPGRFPDRPPNRIAEPATAAFAPRAPGGRSMGLGAGGSMAQKIYPDPYGVETWDERVFGTVKILLVNSDQFRDITGRDPPPTPVSGSTYTERGLPWFGVYDEAEGQVEPAERLTRLKTVAERDRERGDASADQSSIDVPETQIERTVPGAVEPPTRGPNGTTKGTGG